MMENNKEVLLKVEHLEQFFKLGRRQLKAVNDVNFEIYKGEVFGLVGESGCGKTTTGRSIIRLYDITGGSVYFQGHRICAGIGSYKRAIKEAKKAYKLNLNEYTQEVNSKVDNGEIAPEEAKELIATKKAELLSALEQVITENLEKIKSANYDHKNCNKEYAKAQVAKVEEKYKPLFEKYESDNSDESIEALKQLKKAYKNELRIAKKDRIMNQIQMIFQDPIASLDPRMTVRDIIAEGLVIRGIKDKEEIDRRVFEVLETVGLVAEHANRYPHEFSGGQRQRIGIARAIILNPQLIIADEPISALDVSIQAQVINLLNDLSKKMGLTTLFIAHDLAVVKYFSNRIAVMYYGKIVELATSDELFAHPLHPYTKSLLSAIPLPDPYVEKKRKRITYNPIQAHDYKFEQPTMREISEGHFVLCNTAEYEKYLEEIKEDNN